MSTNTAVPENNIAAGAENSRDRIIIRTSIIGILANVGLDLARKIKAMYPDYTVQAVIDADFSET